MSWFKYTKLFYIRCRFKFYTFTSDPYHSLYSSLSKFEWKRLWREAHRKKRVCFKIEEFATKMTFKSKHKVSHATTASINPSLQLFMNGFTNVYFNINQQPTVYIKHRSVGHHNILFVVRCYCLWNNGL